MNLIGLTGISGSGKSSAGRILREMNVPVIDCDAVCRQVETKGEPCLKELAEKFGSSILDQDGNLLRRKLAEIAFSSDEGKAALNSIVHKYILSEIDTRISELSSSYCIIEAPQLF